MKHLRSFVAAAVFGLGLLSGPLAQAQQYPSKVIRILVGFGAGGATDAVARVYAERLSTLLNTTVIVDNRPGASQLAAISALRRSPADGYTLMVAGGSALAMGPAVRKDLGYDVLKDFSLIAMVGSAPGLISVGANFPATTISELIQYIKAHPGVVNYTSAGVGSSGHLEGEYFVKAIGAKMTHVPYKSDAEATRAVAAGDVQVAFTTAQLAMPLIKAGKLRPLLATTLQQASFLPGIPTLADVKDLKLDGLDPYSFFSLLGPVGLPPAIVDRLNDAMNKASAMPDVIERLQTVLYVEPKVMSTGEFRTFVENEITKWNEAGQGIDIGN